MPNKTIPLIMQSVLNTPFMILPSKLEEILHVLQSKDRGELLRNDEFLAIAKEQSDSKNYSVQDGIATITIRGVLSKRMNVMVSLSGGSSYELLGKAFKSALADDEVRGIFLSVDSPGGSVDGVTDLADTIYQGRGIKPSLSYCDGLCTSGAYFVGSAADYIVAANGTTQVGSIGVIASPHIDATKRYETEGLKVTPFYAGRYKMSPNPYTSLSKDDKEYVQSKLDYLYTLFIDTVAKHRNVSSEKVSQKMAEGQIFIGKQAQDVGLIDAVLNREQAITKLKEMIGITISKKHNIAAKNVRSEYMKIEKFDLRSIMEILQSSDNLDELKSIENQCLLHFAEAEKSAKNWIDKDRAKSMAGQVSQLVALRRRQIMSLPEIQKEKERYELGRQIGLSK